MKLDNEAAKKLKKDFPIFRAHPKLIYLDNAATSQKPKQVIEAIKNFYETSNANIHRGLYRLSEKATEEYEKSRRVIADFINAEAEEIIFTKNTTDSMNFLSYSLESAIPNGKTEILLTEMEHHSNLIPFQQLAKRKNLKLKFIKIKKDLILDLEDAKNKITDKTAILSFTHVSNSLGVVNPARELINLAKKHDAITIVDAAQSVPHMKVDVKDLGCDFLAFSGHKILGPMGIGILYGRKKLLAQIPPFEFGGGMIKSVSLENAEFAETPEKFEAGTPNVEGAIGLAEAVKYLGRIGMENIESWEKRLSKYAFEKLSKIEGLKIYSAEKNGSGIISFNLQNIHPHDVSSLLDDYEICVRAGHHCNMPLMKKLGLIGTIRISFYLYNTFEDIDKLASALREIKEKFK